MGFMPNVSFIITLGLYEFENEQYASNLRMNSVPVYLVMQRNEERLEEMDTEKEWRQTGNDLLTASFHSDQKSKKGSDSKPHMFTDWYSLLRYERSK